MNLLFAWRYFKSKKSTNAINIIAWISVVAIMVSTAALIVVLSVFNGFEGLVKGLYSDFYADINIAPAKGKFIEIDSTQASKVAQVPGVHKLNYVVEEKAVLINGDYQTIVYLKGVDEHYLQFGNIGKYIERGNFLVGNEEQPFIVPGAGIANAVGADPQSPFQEMVLYLPNRQAKNFTSLDAMHSYVIAASGIFAVQQEFDDKYAFTHLGFLQYMLDLQPNEFSSLEVSIKNEDEADKIKNLISGILGKSFIVETRYEQNQSLFAIMQMEKWIIFAILSIILSVSAFNMIGALTMLVLEKEKDIAVLKAMGASDNKIRNIFLHEGLLLAGVGGIIGMLLAYLVCWLQINFHLIALQGGTFIIDYYPVKMNVADFVLVSITVVFVAVIASWLPAQKASAKLYSLKS